MRTRRNDVLIPILREKCDRVGEAGVANSACVRASHLRQSGRATWHEAQTRRSMDLRCAGFKYRAASGGTKKTTDPKLVDTHLDKLRMRLMC